MAVLLISSPLPQVLHLQSHTASALFLPLFSILFHNGNWSLAATAYRKMNSKTTRSDWQKMNVQFIFSFICLATDLDIHYTDTKNVRVGRDWDCVHYPCSYLQYNISTSPPGMVLFLSLHCTQLSVYMQTLWWQSSCSGCLLVLSWLVGRNRPAKLGLTVILAQLRFDGIISGALL